MRVAHFRFPSLLESILIARTRSIEQSIESSRRAGRSQGEGMEAGARSLAEVYESEARLVGDLVRPETRMRGPRPRIEAIQDLGPRDHWVDFASPADEPSRAMAFVNQGLARGAKVVALLPSEDVEAYRERAALEVTRRTSPTAGSRCSRSTRRWTPCGAPARPPSSSWPSKGSSMASGPRMPPRCGSSRKSPRDS